MEQNHYFNIESPHRPYTQSLDATPGTFPPLNALRGNAPETNVKGKWPCESGGKWVQTEDHRGEEGYVDGEHTTIKDVGPLPTGWSTTPPGPTEEEKIEQRCAEIIARFAQIDADSVRPLRAIARGEATEADQEKLAALDAEAEALRLELVSLADHIDT
ncbi:MAG: hypothetical protein LBH65_04420 [Desulfovibrio sp.]|jgi:hypothetical protein|nr:hypothetical protein [Desulfovibrio sp.]